MEKLTLEQLQSLNQAKQLVNQAKRELAINEMALENITLKLQILHKLEDGDQITDSGEIVRRVLHPQEIAKEALKNKERAIADAKEYLKSNIPKPPPKARRKSKQEERQTATIEQE